MPDFFSDVVEDEDDEDCCAFEADADTIVVVVVLMTPFFIVSHGNPLATLLTRCSLLALLAMEETLIGTGEGETETGSSFSFASSS